MKAMAIAFLVVGSSLFAATPFTLDCKVEAVNPPGGLFFSNFPDKGPVVGDTIKVDPDVQFVDDITFESGHAVPVKEAGTKLVRRSEQDTLQATYFGSFLTLDNDYTIFYNFYHAETSSYGEFQVLQKNRYGKMALESLEMFCGHVPRRR